MSLSETNGNSRSLNEPYRFDSLAGPVEPPQVGRLEQGGSQPTRSIRVAVASPPPGAADALQGKSAIPALKFIQKRGHHARACGAKWMSKGNRATIHVKPVMPDPEFLHPRHRHRGEGLVDFEQVDVGCGQTAPVQNPARRRDRPGKHELRIRPDNRDRMDSRAGFCAQPIGGRLGHQENSSRAIAKLRCIARRYAAILAETGAGTKHLAGGAAGGGGTPLFQSALLRIRQNRTVASTPYVLGSARTRYPAPVIPSLGYPAGKYSLLERFLPQTETV